MFEQYSYKIKFKFLIAIFIFLSIAAYRRSFSSLILVIKENKILNSKVSSEAMNGKNIGQLNSEITILNKLIGKSGVSKEKIQQEIISFLMKNNPKISINYMRPVHEFEDENYMIYSYQLDLVGNFNQLMHAAYLFEKGFEYSKIISSKFYTDKKNSKKEILHLTLIFQNYENTK